MVLSRKVKYLFIDTQIFFIYFKTQIYGIKMNWIKRYWFEKKIYPVFIDQLDMAFKNNRAVVYWNSGDTLFKGIICIGKKMLIIQKDKELPLAIECVEFSETITNHQYPIKSLAQKEFIELVLTMKTEATTVESQHLIEFLNNQFKNVVAYYHFNREQLAEVYKSVIVDNMVFFSANPPALVIEHENNRWID